MKLEGRIGDRCTFSEIIAGRIRRVVTKGGEQRARILFDIIRSTNGVATSSPMEMDLAAGISPVKQQPPPDPRGMLLPGSPRWTKS